MMSASHDDDSDEAPEEYTAEEGIQQNQEIAKAQQLSIARSRRDVKERRKKWAERLTPRPPKQPSQPDADDIDDIDMVDDGNQNQSQPKLNTNTSGMLPIDIVTLLAAREKQVFLSDSEDDKAVKKTKRTKKTKISGVETVILKELPPAHCVHNSLDFLKKRKMQVPRSSAVLNNSNQALRLLSSSGVLK